MIDLKKEREVFFYELNGRGYEFENKTWIHGLGDVGGLFDDDQLNMVWEMYLAGQESKQAEIDSLKAQLAKVESGEFVVVPKEPTEAMIKHAYGTYEGATILPYSFYKSMIEAAQENSHE